MITNYVNVMKPILHSDHGHDDVDIVLALKTKLL